MEPRISFSVIVPTYNRANLIAKTLATLQLQAYNNYEIIVVDDGSTDNTEEVVNNMTNVRTKYYKKTNAERAVARNYGAKIATSEYVNFFDSDDLALSNHLSEAAKMVKDHNRPEWFHLGYEWASPDGKVFK
ncbi:MAG: glycosyltransferase family A protein, partial [Ferruginibacter sp.]